jgi:hypothetical protein
MTKLFYNLIIKPKKKGKLLMKSDETENDLLESPEVIDEILLDKEFKVSTASIDDRLDRNFEIVPREEKKYKRLKILFIGGAVLASILLYGAVIFFWPYSFILLSCAIVFVHWLL